MKNQYHFHLFLLIPRLVFATACCVFLYFYHFQTVLRSFRNFYAFRSSDCSPFSPGFGARKKKRFSNSPSVRYHLTLSRTATVSPARPELLKSAVATFSEVFGHHGLTFLRNVSNIII